MDYIPPPGISPGRSSIRDTAELRTQMGSVMGTPHYMSPEQARGDIDLLDQRSDIYALGVILYEILALRPPASGTGVVEVLGSVINGRIEPLPKTLPSLKHLPGRRVPESLAAVAMKALSLAPEKRYSTVVELQRDITQYQQGFATRAENAGLVKQVALLVKRHKGVFATAFSAWFVITFLLAWFVINLRNSERETRRQSEIAQQQANLAQQNEKKAVAAEAVALQQKETARQALAKSQLDLAEKEFERGKFVEAQKILEETPESFREANWRFLRTNSRDFTAQLSIAGKANVHRALFLPQGDRFAARFFQDAIGIFTLTGQQVGEWIATKDKDHNAVFGLDGAGAKLAFAASASEVAVVEVETGKLLRRWTCEVGEIKHVLVSPDGETVLVIGVETLTAYATQSGAPLWTQPFKGVVPAFRPDSRTVAMVSAKSGPTVTIQLLDPRTGTARSTLEATGDNPTKTSLQFNQSGARLACLGGDELILWNVRAGLKERTLHFPGETVMLLNPQGDAVATISGSRIRLWDTAAGRLLRSLNGGGSAVKTVAFSSDGKMLLSSRDTGGSGTVMLWPTRLGEALAAVRPGANPNRILFDRRDGATFYASAQPRAGAWETRSGRPQWSFSKANLNIKHFAIHPTDGSVVLSESGKPTITHLTSTGETLEDFGANIDSSLWFSRSARLLLAVERPFDPSYYGRSFTVMEYPTGNVLRTIALEKPGQPFATFCLDDAAVATAAREGGITVWDWHSGAALRKIDAAQTGSIACIATSPDGLHLATGGPDRWIRIWEAATGRLESAFRAHWEGVRCVKFSSDGREILSGSEDGVVRIHDAFTGEQRLAFYGNTSPVVDVDFSPDGLLIAAIAADGYTKVWDRKLSSEAALLPAKPKPAVATDAD